MREPAAPSERTGEMLSGRYRLGRLLGAGGLGAVYESKHPDDGRPVAVKIFSPLDANDDDGGAEIRRCFLEQAYESRRLIHPNIVRVLDVAETEDKTAYFVMELLEGISLGAYTRAGVRVPPNQAATILQGVLAGLGAAHAQGVAHRHLKPDNVILARDEGGTFTAKIVDFGMAKVIDVAGGMTKKTRAGTFLGTPAYMSPEQISNAKDVDARSDLWSAGVLLYEMLTGRVAFPAPTEYARFAAVLSATPPPLESVDRELAPMSAFVQLALQKDPALRFQSALEMARALAGAVGTNSRAMGPAPISELPHIPSVWVPSLQAPAAPPVTAGAAIGVAPEPSPVTTAPAARPPLRAPAKASLLGTLPSENLPMLPVPAPTIVRRGVATPLVVVLVALAFVAGVLLGLVLPRAH